MSRFVFSLVFALLTITARAQDPAEGGLAGKVNGRTYISPTGTFTVSIPVLPELGGTVTDTPNVVTFQDDYNTHISIAAFKHDATQRWELSTRGLKDYLAYFFANFVLADFKQAFEGARIESAKFVSNLLDGAVITSLLLPGGSMFADRVPRIPLANQPDLAKRGNLLFVKNGHTFVISVELAEKVLQGKAFTKTVAEEDEILQQRLLDIVNRIQFAKPPAATAAAPATK